MNQIKDHKQRDRLFIIIYKNLIIIYILQDVTSSKKVTIQDHT